MATPLPSFTHFSNQDLLREVTRLAAREREATARLIASLAELDRRGLYLAQGCASLFAYCVRVLHLAEHAAYDRIEVARAARRFPVILTHLAAGAVTLTTVRLLAPHLTEQNHAALLAEARHRTRREVEQVVARLQPRPDVPSTVRKLPAPPSPSPSPPLPPPSDGPVAEDRAETAVPANAGAASSCATPPPSASGPPPLAPTPTRPAAVVAPLSTRRYKVSFTISAETYAKLQEAQALLRHVIPSGDPALIFERALTLLLADCARTKHAATTRPKPRRPATLRRAQGRRERSREATAPEAPGSPSRRDPAPGVPASTTGVTEGGSPGRSRHIPAEVKRTVWARDGGQCAFVSACGRRCGERGFLEFHHVVPYAKGGEPTVEKVQLRCRQHNAYEATRDFGPWPRCVRETTPRFGVPLQATWFETSVAQSLRQFARPPREREGERERETVPNRCSCAARITPRVYPS